VLGRFPADERERLQPCIDMAVDIIKSFVLAGIDITMNQYNKLGKGNKQRTDTVKHGQTDVASETTQQK
jgi:PTH1 family peptidyl-tRNA hydrolase